VGPPKGVGGSGFLGLFFLMGMGMGLGMGIGDIRKATEFLSFTLMVNVGMAFEMIHLAIL
jgi:hypothetical protein